MCEQHAAEGNADKCMHATTMRERASNTAIRSNYTERQKAHHSAKGAKTTPKHVQAHAYTTAAPRCAMHQP